VSDPALINVSKHLKEMAAVFPYKRAVVYPQTADRSRRVAYCHLTFSQLDRASDRLAHGLEGVGISRGTRTVLMVTPGIDFFVLTFALFKSGAVPVVVDPGMGIKRMVQCLGETEPEAFIGVAKAHLVRLLFRRPFKSVKTFVTVGHRWFWRGYTLKQLGRESEQSYPIAKTLKDETAAILYTTGSTGPAKGVIYTHGIFDAQIRQIQNHFQIGLDEIDLPTFPLFALFDPALGMTAVIPDMDPTKPGFVDPKKIHKAIEDHGVTNMFASPALLDRVGRHGKENGIRHRSLRRVVSAGAPVYPDNIERFSALLHENAEIHTPYGATEGVPVISIGSREILADTRALTEEGYGLCIGRPLEGLEVRVIGISDDPIPKWSDDLVVPDREIGEIAAKGELITRHYLNHPRAESLAKIPDGNDVWHRYGDLGWRDSKGRIWFCGRKDHRVVAGEDTLFTVPCESIFNAHPDVFRSALVGVGTRPKQVPVMCIERDRERKGRPKRQIRKELLVMANQHELTSNIDTFLFHSGFPVDIRHNAKIFRERLAVWAERKL